MESLTLREGRQGFELINDPVEKELKKEVHVIEKAQQSLQQLIDQAFEQLWYDERPPPPRLGTFWAMLAPLMQHCDFHFPVSCRKFDSS